MSVEAKDLYESTQQANNLVGYGIRDKQGNISVKKFVNALDFSLDSIKLREVYERKTRHKDFSFEVGSKPYTQAIINVKFKYSHKLYNKVAKNTYVKTGHLFRNCVMNNCVCVENGELIAIQVNTSVKKEFQIPQEELGNYFVYKDGKYQQNGNIPVIKDKAQLREYLYQNGFVCDGIKYVRYKRSSGSGRVGKCLFVNEILAERMAKWDKCGLPLKIGDKIDLAAWEAYISLPLSSIIDTLEIQPENILLIDDYESIFNDEVVAVDIQDGHLFAEQKIKQICNSIWDGQSLMDSSLFGNYSNKGMLLLRNRFFKTCAFNTNIQQWFKDNNITQINQLNGFTLAKSIKDVKLITTPSSIKYLKFGTIRQWLKNIDSTFGIVKYEKETHYFDGRMVQTHYQLLNTLALSYEDVSNLVKPSLDYIDSVRADPDILRHHIKYPYSEMEITPLNSKNEIVFTLLGINNKFAKTKLYYDFRNDLVKSMIEKLRDGRVLVNGNYSTLFGNGMEMLRASISKFDGNSELKGNEIRSTKFNYGITILGSRSPHVCSGNVSLFSNKRSSLYDTYFNLTNEIVCINSINNNVLQRLNGSDFDSDTILLTDNELLISKAKENYNFFKVPTCFVSANKTIRYYTSEHKADLDTKTSVNKIGEIINLSQQLNSLMWDKYHKGVELDKLHDLYYDICKLAVLSGVEINFSFGVQRCA